MRIHQPLQRKGDGRWDYTVSSDEEGWVHAIGYCAGWIEPEDGVLGQPHADALRARMEPHRGKYHRDGHATSAEAASCYREYELDQHLRFFEDRDTQERCEAPGCGAWTQGRAQLGQFRVFPLCATHQTRDVVAEVSERR